MLASWANAAEPASSRLETATVEAISAALSNKVAEVASEEPTLATVRPDGTVTAAIRFVDDLGQQLLDTDGAGEKFLALNESIVAALDALKARRMYKYQLWAESRLEQVTEQWAKGKASTSDKIKLYLALGEINASYISENMLNREIMSTMAMIYDGLDDESKKQVRRQAIQQQADPMASIRQLQPRKTPDDF